MSILKLCIGLLAGFVVGAYFYHPAVVKASSGSGTIFLRQVTPGANTDPIIANREIVGFSCATGAMGAECYVAVR